MKLYTEEIIMLRMLCYLTMDLITLIVVSVYVSQLHWQVFIVVCLSIMIKVLICDWEEDIKYNGVKEDLL